MARKTNNVNLEKKLKKFVREIIESFNVDQIILFGSYAKGHSHKYSDIDIAVISPDLNPKNSIWKNVRAIKEKTKLIDPYLQLTAFPSKVFYNEAFIDNKFIQEIKRTGITIYPVK